MAREMFFKQRYDYSIYKNDPVIKVKAPIGSTITLYNTIKDVSVQRTVSEDWTYFKHVLKPLSNEGTEIWAIMISNGTIFNRTLLKRNRELEQVNINSGKTTVYEVVLDKFSGTIESGTDYSYTGQYSVCEDSKRGFKYLKLTSSGILYLNSLSTLDVVVIGGGGGGSSCGGGGGGGYYRRQIIRTPATKDIDSTQTDKFLSSYQVIIGEGGESDQNGGESCIKLIDPTKTLTGFDCPIYDEVGLQRLPLESDYQDPTACPVLIKAGGGKTGDSSGNGGAGGSGGGGCGRMGYDGGAGGVNGSNGYPGKQTANHQTNGGIGSGISTLSIDMMIDEKGKPLYSLGGGGSGGYKYTNQDFGGEFFINVITGFIAGVTTIHLDEWGDYYRLSKWDNTKKFGAGGSGNLLGGDGGFYNANGKGYTPPNNNYSNYKLLPNNGCGGGGGGLMIVTDLVDNSDPVPGGSGSSGVVLIRFL